MTLDASGQYRRDPRHAERLCRKLEALWGDIEARFEQTPGLEDDQPLWTENTLAMAIVSEVKTVFVRPPEVVSGANEAVDTELFGVWFARIVRDFRGAERSRTSSSSAGDGWPRPGRAACTARQPLLNTNVGSAVGLRSTHAVSGSVEPPLVSMRMRTAFASGRRVNSWPVTWTLPGYGKGNLDALRSAPSQTG